MSKTNLPRMTAPSGSDWLRGDGWALSRAPAGGFRGGLGAARDLRRRQLTPVSFDYVDDPRSRPVRQAKQGVKV
jgi:hypothetical protein